MLFSKAKHSKANTVIELKQMPSQVSQKINVKEIKTVWIGNPTFVFKLSLAAINQFWKLCVPLPIDSIVDGQSNGTFEIGCLGTWVCSAMAWDG